MAQLNRPLTEGEILLLLTSRWAPSLESPFRDLCFTGESHQFVRYDAKLDRVVYEDVQHFYWTDPSPSDSRWMVPK